MIRAATPDSDCKDNWKSPGVKDKEGLFFFFYRVLWLATETGSNFKPGAQLHVTVPPELVLWRASRNGRCHRASILGDKTELRRGTGA